MHFNTKNSTRFDGVNTAEIAGQVSWAVYPATDDSTTPHAVTLYDEADWQGGLRAAALLKPLNYRRTAGVTVEHADTSAFLSSIHQRQRDL